MDVESKFHIIESSPEVKSFIYQQLQDFEPYLTPKTSVSVVSNDLNNSPLHFYDEKNESNSGAPPIIFKITISIKENQTILEDEGISSNIFEAILTAKNKLYQKLIRFYDEVITQEDRIKQIINSKTSIVH